MNQQFRDRDYGISPSYETAEMARLSSNKQIAIVVGLLALGGTAAGFGATLALAKVLDQSEQARAEVGQLQRLIRRKVADYTDALETDILHFLSPLYEDEVLAYHKGIAGTPFGAALLEAIIAEERDVLFFVVEKARTSAPVVKHVRHGRLEHQTAGDQFVLSAASLQTTFDRSEIVNLFSIRQRPCLVVRVYPDQQP